jgi:hypothetical protein
LIIVSYPCIIVVIAKKQQISWLIGLQHEKQKFHKLSSKFLGSQEIAAENQPKPLTC